MGDHLVNEGSAIPVFRQSDLYDQKGTLYNGEVFINLGVTTGYLNSWEVRFVTAMETLTVDLSDLAFLADCILMAKELQIQLLEVAIDLKLVLHLF